MALAPAHIPSNHLVAFCGVDAEVVAHVGAVPQQSYAVCQSPADASVLVVNPGAPDALKAIESWSGSVEMIILFSALHDEQNLALLQKYQIRHLIGANGVAPEFELANVLLRLTSQAIWGLDLYVPEPDFSADYQVRAVDELDHVTRQLLSQVAAGSLFKMASDYLRVVMMELLSNAIYNAPRDQAGRAKYEKVDRRVKVVLSKDESPSVSVAVNKTAFGISVADRYGSLTFERVMRHLAKFGTDYVVDRKQGGAGAGLCMIFHSANIFIVNSCPGKRNEMICIVEKTRRYKVFRSRTTSMHFFETEEV